MVERFELYSTLQFTRFKRHHPHFSLTIHFLLIVIFLMIGLSHR